MGKKARSKRSTSNAAVQAKTGKAWEEWFKILDDWGAREKGHRLTARHLAEVHGLSPWWSQTVTVHFERERGLRVVGQRGSFFTATVQRTVAASAAQAYAGLTDPAMLSRWFAQEARADLKVGGRYENSDGGAGEFLFLDPPRRLKFTWEHRVHCPGTVVEIEILPGGSSGDHPGDSLQTEV